MTRNYSSTAVATTLSTGCTSVSTTISVSSTAGFPAAPFILALDAGVSAQELVLVTGVSGLDLTVTRGYDSTSAQAHSTGAVVQHVHGAVDFREARQHEAATTGVHGTSGSLVGTTGAQTLTGKTLSVDDNTLNGFPASSFLLSDETGRADGAAAQKPVPTGEVVGTTDAQTLTNKTLTDPIVNANGAPTRVIRYVATDPDVAANAGDLWYDTTGKVWLRVGTSWVELATATSVQTFTNKDLSAASNTFPAWQAYTPTLTNFTGAISYARYQKVGKTVRGQVKITFDIATASTSAMGVSLPVAPRTGHPSSIWDSPVGMVALATHPTGGERYTGQVVYAGSSRVHFVGIPFSSSSAHTSTQWTATNMGFDTDGYMGFQFEYETD